MTGTGDVVGPAGADDEAIARYDGVTGLLLQNSPIKINDAGAFRDWIYNRIAPAALAANADDYAPAGWANADLLVQDTTGGNWTITGFAAITATAGVLRKLVLNESDECVLTLAHAGVGSVAANQILCPGDENIHLKPREAIVLVYDTTATRWRVIGRSEEHLTTYNFQGDSAGATEDDYAPTGAEEWASADVVEITCPEGGTIISGFDASALVQERKIIVAGDDEGLTIQHQGAGSLAANRINCPRSVDMVLSRYEAAMLMYDGAVWTAVALSETAAVYTIEETIAAQADDYEPSNWATLDMLRVQLTGSQTITGFVALSAHNYKSIVNADASDTLTLAHESASSTAGNRIITPTGTNLAIPPGHVVELAYDSVESRWRVVSVIARAATTAPVDVTKAAASAGTDPDYARRDHKHNITTAAPVTVGTANAEGGGSELARAAHVHAHGAQPLGAGTDHAVATTLTAGFMSAADKVALDSIGDVGVGGVMLMPEFAALGPDTTQSALTTFAGASFLVGKNVSFNRLYAFITAFTAGALLRVLIYQKAGGSGEGLMSLKATMAGVAVGATGVLTMTPAEGTVTLEAGYCVVLFGKETATNVTLGTYDPHSTYDLLTVNVPATVHPLVMTTVISAATSPATFNPLTQSTPNVAPAIPVLRLAVV
jgi:hypothetical protein